MKPKDSIPRLLKRISKRLQDCKLPWEFTAYSALQHGEWTLGMGGLDFHALQCNDREVVERYTPLSARLDPTKTVSEYFGSTGMRWEFAVVVEWTAAALKTYKELQKQMEVELAADGIIAPGPDPRLCLNVMLAHHRNIVFDAIVEPTDTIATALKFIAETLDEYWESVEATARLDPTKRVHDYFDTILRSNEIHIVVLWTPKGAFGAIDANDKASTFVRSDGPLRSTNTASANKKNVVDNAKKKN